VMNSLPPWRRGVGAGMMNTFQNSAQVLSIGIFFSLMIIGLSAHLPETLYHGIVAHGVAPKTASAISHLPPVTTLFATFLGYNPMRHLLGAHVLASLPAGQVGVLLGHRFFPALITKPFASALHSAFTFAAITCVAASVASLLRGGRHEWSEPEVSTVTTDSGEDEELSSTGADDAQPPAVGGQLNRPPLGTIEPRPG
jgi:hypothetical protein